MLGRMFGFGRNERYDRGLRYFDQGLYEQAVEELEAVIDDSSDADTLSKRLAKFYVAEAYSNLGVSALQKQSYEHARDYLGKALELNGHYADLHLHYGRACRKLGDRPCALKAFDAAVSINPKFAKALFFRGLILVEIGVPEDGFRQIQDAAEIDPGFATDTFEEAVRSLNAGDPEKARSLFEQIAESDVDDIGYHVGLGTDLYRRGMYDQAIEEFQKALALNSHYADIHNHLAIAYNARGNYNEAIEHFKQAISINPKFIEARTNLGLTLRAANRPDDARDEFQRVLEMDPDNVLARENMTH